MSHGKRLAPFLFILPSVLTTCPPAEPLRWPKVLLCQGKSEAAQTLISRVFWWQVGQQ